MIRAGRAQTCPQHFRLEGKGLGGHDLIAAIESRRNGDCAVSLAPCCDPAQLEEIEVIPVRRARVVINERTGTIVAGGDVRLSPAAIVHGNLTITVKETPVVSQPNAGLLGGAGDTKVVQRSDVKVDDSKKDVTYMKAAPTLADVASALGSLGLSPRELAGVLQALRAANALEAELVVQ